jgi:hypothetical protein
VDVQTITGRYTPEDRTLLNKEVEGRDVVASHIALDFTTTILTANWTLLRRKVCLLKNKGGTNTITSARKFSWRQHS